MKLYPSDSLESMFYLGLIIRKIIFIPPPTSNDDLEGPHLLMASKPHTHLQYTDCTLNDTTGINTCCTIDSKNVTQCYAT